MVCLNVSGTLQTASSYGGSLVWHPMQTSSVSETHSCLGICCSLMTQLRASESMLCRICHYGTPAIYLALAEEAGGPSTPFHCQIVIANPDVLFAKYSAYRSIVEQTDLLDSLSESVEATLTVRLQAQFKACIADQWLALGYLRENAWRLVLHYLREGNILEAKQYIEGTFPRLSQMMDENPGLTYETYEYLLTSLEEKFYGQELNLSIDTHQYLASLACFRLMHLKAMNLGFIISMVESFVSDLERKRDYLMGRLKLRTLMGAAFAN